ncbi:Protein SMG7, partial [Ananas comosus]
MASGPTSAMLTNQIKASELAISSMLDTVVPSGITTDKFAAALPTPPRKNPVSRPVRHNGPPPGFSPVPSKQHENPISNSVTKDPYPQIDDYRWLDGYQPSSAKGMGIENPINHGVTRTPRLEGRKGSTGGVLMAANLLQHVHFTLRMGARALFTGVNKITVEAFPFCRVDDVSEDSPREDSAHWIFGLNVASYTATRSKDK